MPTPEAEARQNIDRLLEESGWILQDSGKENLSAGRGIAIREFPLQRGHGKADYLLYVDRKAAGVVEAKPEGETLTGVEVQAEKYSTGLPATLPAHFRPLQSPRTCAPRWRRSRKSRATWLRGNPARDLEESRNQD